MTNSQKDNLKKTAHHTIVPVHRTNAPDLTKWPTSWINLVDTSIVQFGPGVNSPPVMCISKWQTQWNCGNVRRNLPFQRSWQQAAGYDWYGGGGGDDNILGIFDNAAGGDFKPLADDGDVTDPSTSIHLNTAKVINLYNGGLLLR